MTLATKHTRRSALPAALFGALLLAGCSTGHIGESWQCPLTEGGSCDSVAAADPAVPKADPVRSSALTEPLWRVRDAGRAEAPERPPCAAGCGAGFDPFAWLMGLFEGGDGDGRTATAIPAQGPEDAGAQGSPERAAPRENKVPAAEPAPETVAAPAALPAEPEAAEAQAGDEDRPAGDLRTGEVVARIWIAPFVDAEGIYREASHVRVVLEPAGWRVE